MSVRLGAARIEYVDGLRAIAVLTVIAAHVVAHAPRHPGLVSHAMSEGVHGVDLFFVLSGFCLAYPTLSKWRSGLATGFNLADFGAKRLVRIAPPFYIATLVFVAAGLAAHFLGHGAVLNVPPAFDLAKSLLFIDERTQLINTSFWTLMVEFRWYFVFPFVLILWLRSPRAFVTLGLASMVLYSFTRARGLDFGTLPAFMLGIIAADIHVGARVSDRLAELAKRHAIWLAVVCGAAGIAVEPSVTIPGFDGNDVRWPYVPTIPAWQLAAFFFVIAAGSIPVLRATLAWRGLVATGVASYAIYLMHEPIIAALEAKSIGPATGPVAAIVALAAGFAFWAVVERPFTTGRLRSPLVGALRPLVERACAFTGFPSVLSVPAPPEPASDVRQEAEPEIPIGVRLPVSPAFAATRGVR